MAIISKDYLDELKKLRASYNVLWSTNSQFTHTWISKIKNVARYTFDDYEKKVQELDRAHQSWTTSINSGSGRLLGTIDVWIHEIMIAPIAKSIAPSVHSETSRNTDRIIVEYSIQSQLRVFIAHDGDTPQRRALENFVRALGGEPIVAEAEFSGETYLDEHVTETMRTCQYGIALATLVRPSQQDGRPAPRGNVSIELERMRRVFEKRWLAMVERDVVVPSDHAAFVRAEFTWPTMQEALTRLVVELRGHKLLRTSGVPMS